MLLNKVCILGSLFVVVNFSNILHAQSTGTDAEVDSAFYYDNALTFSNRQNDDLSVNVFNVPELSERYREISRSGILSAYFNAPYLDGAFAKFDSLINMRPDRPEGYFLKAVLYYAITLSDNSETIQDSLDYYSESAIEITENLLKSDPDNQYYHFYLGAVHGNLGLQSLKSSNYWSAYRNGSKGKSYLEKALELDPGLEDAKLGIGMFQYYVDVLPKYLKFFLFFVRMRGDRETGMKNIISVKNNGTIAKVEANLFIARIFNEYEGRAEESEILFKELHEAYPGNYYFKWHLGRFYYENGMMAKAAQVFGDMQKKPHKYYNRSVRYYLGNTLHQTADYNNSNKHLLVAVNLLKAGNDEPLRKRLGEVYFKIGLNYDYLGDRKKALQYYDLAGESGSKELRNEVKKHVRSPFTEHDLAINAIEALIKKGEVAEAFKTIQNRIDSARTDNDYQNYLAVYDLLSAEIFLRQSNYDEVILFLRKYPEKNFTGKELRARYHFVGAFSNLHDNNMNGVEMHLKRLDKIDLNKMPVFFLRTFNTIQNRAFGDIRYR